MQSKPENTFHFLSEISKDQTYRQLFPDPKAGLAVIWLYERIQNGTFEQNAFTERDIHQALKEVNPSIEQDKSRHPKEHYNAIIAELQEYFLRYDEERQTYSFKEYAVMFCRHAYAILQASFSPTRIEKICSVLRKKLETCDNLEKLSEWFKLDFDAFKPQLKSQLDYLDRHIDQSVNSLRENKKLSFRDGTVLDTLKQIDQRFETIREQNKELRTAFREIEQIRRLMDGYSSKHDDSKLDESIHAAVVFFQEMRRTLTLIDKRLDRIQPKIRQLFSNLNKPLFDSRVEQFLHHLVEKSVEVNEGTKKIIQLPLGVPRLSVFKQHQDLIIVERRKDLLPVQAQKRMRIQESLEGKSKAFASFQHRLAQQDDISSWLLQIQSEVDSQSSLNLSDYFFKIVRLSDPSTITLGIAVVYRAVNLFERSPFYEVIIHQDRSIGHPDFKTFLSHIVIHKKP